MWWIWLAACAPPENSPAPVAPAATTPSTAPATTTTGATSPTASSGTTPATVVGTGTASFRDTWDGQPRCDQVVDLALTSDAGPCPDCTFTTRVGATSVVDEGTFGDCGPWSTGWADETNASFSKTELQVNLRLAHADTYVDAWGATASNALLRGYDSVDTYGGEDSFEGAWELYASAAPQPTFALTPDEYTYDGASGHVGRTVTVPVLDGAMCYQDVWGAEAGLPVTGTTASGDIPCDGETSDVWAFDARAGDGLTVAVDVADPATAFDPFAQIQRDGCDYYRTDDTFDCTASIRPAGCPGGTFVAPSDGVYQVVVRAVGPSCVGPVGAYSLTVDGASAPNLRLVDDDVAGGAGLHKWVRTWTLDFQLD